MSAFSPEASLNVVKEAVKEYGVPEIINSDQGSQFTCIQWQEYWKEKSVKISMDGKGRSIDNVFIERLWRTVKYNHVYLNPPKDGLELYQGLQQCFKYHNYKRSHQGIERKKPAELFLKAA